MNAAMSKKGYARRHATLASVPSSYHASPCVPQQYPRRKRQFEEKILGNQRSTCPTAASTRKNGLSCTAEPRCVPVSKRQGFVGCLHMTRAGATWKPLKTRYRL